MKETREVVILKLDDILPNRFQPRIKFDEKAIVELSESIKEHGVIQPIIVRKISDKYEIIAGERRYKASVMAGKETIPAIVVELDDKDSSEIALIENVQRQDLTPIEEAISYRKILDMGYLTQDELANKLGVAQSTVANKLRLLNLDDEVQDALLDEKISERHARSLLKLDKPSMQKEMLKRIINERLTVRKTDEEIEKMINNVSPFDSIENNMNQNINNEPVKQEPILNDNANPFIINNEVNNIPSDIPQSIINEEPINVVPENVEVLDFNDFMVDSGNINPEPENINNFPSMPIIEDEPTQENVVPNILEEDNNLEGQINTSEEFKPEFDQKIDTNVEPINNEPINESNSMVEEQKQPSDDDNVLRPGKFFNILSTDNEEEQISNEENNINETSMPFSNTVTETPAMPNIFNQAYNDNISEDKSYESNINDSDIRSFDYNTPSVTPVYENNIVEDKKEENNNITNLRDVINMIRDCADKIEKNNFDIDVEEFDFDDLYQIIFKIKK